MGNLKILFIIYALLFSIIYSIDSTSQNELTRLSSYYSELGKHLGMTGRFKVKVDNSQLYLEAMNNFEAKSPVLAMHRSLFLSSCDFFPFKEVVLRAFVDIRKETGMDIKQLTMIFTLTYNILYYKIGDRTKARNYYKKFWDDDMLHRDSYIKFDVKEEVKDYLRNLPKKSINSILKYSEEEIKLVKDLGLDMSFYSNINAIYDYINHRISLLEPDIRVL